MMQTIAESGAGLSGASALHMNIFGLNPVVVFGSEEQKRRMLPPMVAGTDSVFSPSPSPIGPRHAQAGNQGERRRRLHCHGQKSGLATRRSQQDPFVTRTTPIE